MCGTIKTLEQIESKIKNEMNEWIHAEHEQRNKVEILKEYSAEAKQTAFPELLLFCLKGGLMPVTWEKNTSRRCKGCQN